MRALNITITLTLPLLFFACDDGGAGGGGGNQDSSFGGNLDATPQDGAPPQCQESTRRCGAAGVEVCTAGQWQPLSACPAGTECADGECTPAGCQPNCGDRTCGLDGCGGTCGQCTGGDVCADGQCSPPPPRCGDDACNGDEDCGTCPADCGNCCGDGACDAANENCATCPADCDCEGDDRCDAQAQMCEACAPQCAGRECGADGCGGTCGDCAEGVDCDNGLCAACVPQCDDRACGDDGCDGVCGDCAGGQICGRDGQCADAPAACGDDTCDAGEDCANCPADCGLCCGNGACDNGVGENCATCPADCGCAEGQLCNPERRACVGACVPQCDGRNCDDDGCGGVCGLCAGAQECVDGVCRDVCVPACEGRMCGGDGCDGRCGECDGDALCDDGVCVQPCVPDCEGKVCGDDSCGDSCGPCAGGEFCSPDGQCVAECVPDCAGRACGDDSCGDVCGMCPAGAMCTADGRCEDPGALCNCVGDAVCLDGFCRAPDELCGDDNPIGLCVTGQDCLAGVCTNRGNACSPQNPTGVCPLGEVCRDGDCLAFDGEALCDDANACTADRFAAAANRCENTPMDAACSDGNGCTMNRCVDGACVADPIPGCIEPPTIDPYVTPTNDGVLNLGGTKPAGASIRVNGEEAVPESPDERWGVVINLQPGENVFRVRSVDQGEQSAEVEVRVVYDITAPTVAVGPAGGVFLNPVSITVVADEPATVYYTDDGATPDRWSKSFRSARQFRIFHDTTLRFRALDDAGNWQEAISSASFEISGDGARWTSAAALPEPRTLSTAQLLGTSLYVVGGTDGLAAQAGVDVWDIATGEWSLGPALQVARAQLASAVSGNRLFIVGGESDGLPLNLLQRLAPDRMSWETLAPMPSTRFGLAAVPHGGKLYAFGGKTNGGVVLDVVEVYDILTDNWTNQVAQMPRPRFGHAAVEHDGKIYLVGGEDEAGNPIAAVDVYEVAANEWTHPDDLPTPRSRLTLTKHQNEGAVQGPHVELVAAGGLTAGGAPSAVVEAYVIERDVWRERAPLDAPRHSAAAVAGSRPAEVDTQQRRGWIIGGQRAGVVTDDLSYYTREQDYLRLLPELPEGRFMAAAEEVDGLFYVFGGRAFQETSTVWAYDPETGRTAERSPLPKLQNGLGSAVIDGLIYAAGGANNFGLAVPWLHVYDAADDTWTELRPMPTARKDPAVVALDGRLWVIGGDNNGPVQSVEIYDPATDTWMAGPVLPAGRTGARALVHDGDIILAFGRGPANAAGNVLRFADGQWRPYLASCTECETFEYGQITLVHDHQLNIFGGRVDGAISDVIYSVDLSDQQDVPRLRQDTNLLRPVDHAATVYHHGRFYLLGGNDNAAEPGPGGLTHVQQVEGHCFNGRLDPGETDVDTGGGCATLFPVECRNYTVLDSAGRAVESGTGNLCDRDLQVGRWYRLEGSGGTRFITSNPRVDNRCGTDATGYLTGGNPSPADGVVQRNVCYYFLRNNCWSSSALRMRNCGGYYVYNFTAVTQSCGAALCTE